MSANRNIALGSIAVLTLIAAAATANTEVIESPNPAPGPRHISITPHYFDPDHQESDYRYWQKLHEEKLFERQKYEREMEIRRAEADRQLRLEQQQSSR